MNIHDAITFFKINSKTQEKYVEYCFLKDLILEGAIKNTNVAVSRSDFDAFGFDVILGKGSKVILLQLKAYTGETKLWDVHKSLLEAENGRIVLAHLEVIEAKDKTPVMRISYHLYNRGFCTTTLQRLPKIKHALKCRSILSDYDEDITGRLFRIFD